MPIGPAQQYLAKYNDYVLPGYVQSEAFASVADIASHNAPYADGAAAEYTGLREKELTVRLKVWEPDYLTVKNEIEKAATYLRSKRSGYGRLYLHYSDRHYDVMVQTVRFSKEAGSSVRLGEYETVFSGKPVLVSDASHTLTGTTLLDTDSVSRTISNGGWTPTVVTLTGTNITVSGYTATGDFTGFISVSGAVTNLIVDSEAYTATISGVNKNNLMKSVDYQLFVGPARTYFAITGASSCSRT